MVFKRLGRAELNAPLRWDVQRFSGLRVAAFSLCGFGDVQFADTRQGEFFVLVKLFNGGRGQIVQQIFDCRFAEFGVEFLQSVDQFFLSHVFSRLWYGCRYKPAISIAICRYCSVSPTRSYSRRYWLVLVI